jgi:hypothetical protein
VSDQFICDTLIVPHAAFDLPALSLTCCLLAAVFMTLDNLKLEAQSVLDDLWAKDLIPFQLTAHRVESLGPQEYIIRFLDSRLYSVDVT